MHRVRQLLQHRSDIIDVHHVRHMDGDSGVDQRLRVLATVLLLVEHHHVRRQLDDRVDVGIFGATHVQQRRLLAEPSARDHRHPPRQQRLGDRRHQADDPHGALSTGSGAQQLALLRLELVERQRATLQHPFEPFELLGDTDDAI
jgi:hypothetical protein